MNTYIFYVQDETHEHPTQSNIIPKVQSTITLKGNAYTVEGVQLEYKVSGNELMAIVHIYLS